MTSTFITIWLLQVAAMVVPGPNFLFVSHLAASSGRRSSIYGAVGVAIGATILASAAALGVGALFRAAPTLRLLLQVAGATYLVYLAIRLWRLPVGSATSTGTVAPVGGALRAGLLTNLSNPKSILFFGSVFSTALPDSPTGPTMLAAVLMMGFNSLWWHVLLACTFSIAPIRTQYARRRDLLSRAGGTVLGAFGASLLWASLREARGRF